MEATNFYRLDGLGLDEVDFNKTQAFKIVNEHLTIENKSIVKQINSENKSIYTNNKI